MLLTCPNEIVANNIATNVILILLIVIIIILSFCSYEISTSFSYYIFALHIEASYSLLILSTNSSGVSISILEKPNHFLPKSFMDAPM